MSDDEEKERKGAQLRFKNELRPPFFTQERAASPFFTQGIIIRMYAEAGVPHHRPHFHAYCQDEIGVYGIDVIEIIAGSLPRRQHRLVEAWAELRQGELLTNWARLPQAIAPLQ